MLGTLLPHLTLKEPEFAPWCAGLAQCLDCGRKWTAVWPLGAEALECPECGGDNTDRDAVTGA